MEDQNLGLVGFEGSGWVVVVHRQTLVGIVRCSVDFSEQKLNIRSRSS